MFWTLVFIAVAACTYYIWNWHHSKKRVTGITKKSVFITGCDSGFGNALARRLDGLGVPVFAGCQTEKGATALKEKVSERLQTVLVDVTSHDSILQAYEFVKNNLPDGAELWGVVNNAGIGGKGGPLEYMSRKAFNIVYEINLIGLIDVTQTFLPLVKKSEGRIVNMASAHAICHIPGLYPYATAKHAVRAFTGCLRNEKKPYGIKVACILPGYFRTPAAVNAQFREKATRQWDNLPQQVKEDIGEEYHSKMIESTVKAVSGSPEDITPVLDAYEHALFAEKPHDEYFPGKEATIAHYITMLPEPLVQLSFKLGIIGNALSDLAVPRDLAQKATR